MNMPKTLIALTTLIGLIPATLAANPPLREVPAIDNEIFYGAVANEIDEHCDSIVGLRAKAITKLLQLRSQANAMGYTDAEIRAYVESDAEKARMRARGEAYLAANGVKYGQPETFCALGRAEIARNSAIGVYLKAK